MEFKEILGRYENDIEYANRMLEPKSLSFFKETKEYWQGYKRASFKWFQYMKNKIEFFPETQAMTEDEKIDNIYVDAFNNYYYPHQWLYYRGEKVPVYSDEYGQQDFILYQGKECYGGAYNFCPECDFCAFIDEIKDGIM